MVEPGSRNLETTMAKTATEKHREWRRRHPERYRESQRRAYHKRKAQDIIPYFDRSRYVTITQLQRAQANKFKILWERCYHGDATFIGYKEKNA